MRAIRDKVFTHLAPGRAGGDLLPRFATVACIRKGNAPVLSSFRDLVARVSEVASGNPDRYVLFRGQNRDFRNGAGESTLLPTFFRAPPGKRGLSSAELARRHRRLLGCEHVLVERRSEYQHRIGMSRFSEFARAILQHYGVCATPLLDLTQSLRVAASFALMGSTEGYVYVLGVPYPHGCISYEAEEGLVLAHLLAACPPKALRPSYQQGYLLGRFPFEPVRRPEDDAARRLLAKYRLAGDASFWDEEFRPVPLEALLPSRDPFYDQLAEMLELDGS